MSKTFTSPVHFRQSLEGRLQNLSRETGTDLQRIRRKVAFDRFLARLFLKRPFQWILRGGYALETRFGAARTTKDLDLGTALMLVGTKAERQGALREMLQGQASADLQDFFAFQISGVKTLESPPAGGCRFSVRSLVSGRLFVGFTLNVGIGDAWTPPVQELEGQDWLHFCGVPPARFEAISLEQQLAEKIHALSVKRGERENTRVKDLVDVSLLIRSQLNLRWVRQALSDTFERRDGAPPPDCLPDLPKNWAQLYASMAHECGLSGDFHRAIETLELFWASLALED